jgi:pimeloyl-ACP methyl ester carboxylesterase
VHGNGGHAHWWDGLVPALVPGWRLVALDLRGHGESDWAEPPRYRLEHFADDLTPVLDRLTEGPVALVGHSMGGRVAVWFAGRHPERVRGLAVLDSRMTRVGRDDAARWRAGVAGKRHGRGYPTRGAALSAFRFVPPEPGVPEAVVANLAHHAVHERGPGDWTFRFDRAVLALDGDGAVDLSGALGRVRCPTLLMAGADSWVMDAAELRAVAAAIPGSSVRVLPGAHHFLTAHGAAAGAALRDFLDALPARAAGG